MEEVIRCAIPLLGPRVAPRFMFSSSLLVAQIKNKEVISTKTETTEDLDEYRRLELLLDLEVDVIVCGGISQSMSELISDCNINVICNVAGEYEEVIRAFADEKLHPWFGYNQKKEDADSNKKHGPVSVTEASSDVPCSCRARRRMWEKPSKDTAFEKPKKSGNDLFLASLSLTPVCKVGEMKAIFKKRGYKRIGITYCSDLSDLAESMIDDLAPVVEVFGSVCPADCMSQTNADHEHGCEACSPTKLGDIFKQKECEAIVILGMCDAFYRALNSFSDVPSMLVVPGSMEKVQDVPVSEIG
jgi:predicted Fe-Mo cluster-binding NifX family protein/uncharacterized metal-binding protein